MIRGRLIAVVGASGVGKDSVIDGICAARPDLIRVRRTITRPEEQGGETFEAISPEMFEKSKNEGQFALSWGAHGLFYGIRVERLEPLADGRELIVNLSRGILGPAQQAFPGLRVLHLTARPETLARRLAGRGRETAEEIAGRLAQADRALPAGLSLVTVSNDGPLAETVAAALAALYPVRV